MLHDNVMKWKHFPVCWLCVQGIHRSPVNSPRKGQWHGALMFPLICAWASDWVNNQDAGDMRRHRDHYDVVVMDRRSSKQETEHQSRRLSLHWFGVSQNKDGKLWFVHWGWIKYSHLTWCHLWIRPNWEYSYTANSLNSGCVIPCCGSISLFPYFIMSSLACNTDTRWNIFVLLCIITWSS